MDVPPDNSNLSDYVEDMMNVASIVEYHCQDGCNAYYQAETRSQLKSVRETQFLIFLLKRNEITENGPRIVQNKVLATQDLIIR